MPSPFVKRYLLALQRYKWFGLGGGLLVLGAAGFVASRPPEPPTYITNSVLVQNTPAVSFTTTGTDIQQQGQGVITEDFLLADVLLEQLVFQLDRQGINRSPQQIRSNTRVVIQNNGGSQRVILGYESTNPEDGTVVMSLMTEGMIELSRQTNRARLQSILDALDERLPEAEADLRQAEQALETYDRIEGPAIQAATDGSLLTAILNSQQQRRQGAIQIAGIDAEMRSLQNRLGLTPEQAYASAALSADPIIASLRGEIYQTETQIQLQSRQLRPAHPEMQQLQSDLAAYEQLLQARAQEVISGGNLQPLPSGNLVRQESNLDPARAALANQLSSLQTQRDSIVQQMQTLAESEVQLQEEYANLPNKQLERDRLAQQVALKRALYDRIQTKRVDAVSADAETVSSLTVFEPPATRRVDADAANPVVVLLAGGLIGLVVGGGIVFLLNMLDGKVRTYDELEGLFADQDVPLLGIVPWIPVQPSFVPDLLTQPHSSYRELYERCRSNLNLVGASVNGGKRPRMVLVVSNQPKEGKSFTAYNLAIASAQAGRRTLLIEADLRSHSQAHIIGITPDDQAAVEPLRYYGGKVGRCIRLVPRIENLYIVPSPGPQAQAAAILESSELRLLLEDARQRFDFVVIDTPTLTQCNDAMMLEHLTDGMILVTQPGISEKAVVTQSLEQFEENEDVRLLAALINGADLQVDQSIAAQPPMDLPDVENAQTAADDLLLEREFNRTPASIDF